MRQLQPSSGDLQRSRGFDIAAGISQTRLGPAITEHLALKGFCVCDLGIRPELAEQALQDANAVVGRGGFFQPPREVLGGLLGEGSQEVAHLAGAASEEESGEEADGPGIQQLDVVMTTIAERLQPYLPSLGFSATERTYGLLHSSGGDPHSEEKLTEVVCQKWLTQFWWHRVMMLVFLGPEEGTLELEPFDEGDIHRVPTAPGTMVLLRADLMARTHVARGRSFALSCFLRASCGEPKPPPTPTVQELVTWTAQRLQNQMGDEIWGEQVPREFQRMANHLYHKGPRAAVSAVMCRLASTWDSDCYRCALTGGPDFVREAQTRWDTFNPAFYNADPECIWYSSATFTKHGTFIDGVELFDNKQYTLSANEARGMDPGQRHILELSYEGLWGSGLRKKEIHNSYTAVYVSVSSGEWVNTPKCAESAQSLGSGGVQCIYSNRVSYVLGLKGPSISIDQEAAGGLSAVHLGCGAVKEQWPHGESRGSTTSPHSLCLGSYLMLSFSDHYWQVKQGIFNPVGRCCSFDGDSKGIARGDAVAGCTVKSFLSYAEGEASPAEQPGVESRGMIAASGTNSSGMASTMQVPVGPSQQELIAKALRDARLSPLDIDFAEVHGDGRILSDAVDVMTALLALRSGDELSLNGLPCGTSKTGVSHTKEGAASVALVKALVGAQYGTIHPNVHLRTMNPHLDASGIEELALIVSESVSVGSPSTYTSIMSHGQGGSNAHVLCWNCTSEGMAAPSRPALKRSQIVFWPGGGGEGEQTSGDDDDFHIVGTWSRWKDPIPMEAEGDGIFGFTITLGENRFEQFQIWVAGDSERVLHPEEPKAPKGTTAFGPAAFEDVAGYRWMIDGRKTTVHDGDEVYEMGTLDSGRIGDEYRVRLHIAGQWRAVSWEKIEIASVEDSGKALQVVRSSARYFITGSFNSWALLEMQQTESGSGFYVADIFLKGLGTDFQIIKDEDWYQVFHPSYNYAGPWFPEDVQGPDDDARAQMCWWLDGRPGEKAQVIFQRALEPESETRRVWWHWPDRGESQ